MASVHEIAGLIGLALMVGSSLVQSVVYSGTQDLEQTAALPVLTAQDEVYLSGARCLIEATVGAGNPLLFRDFVAYRAERYEGESCDDGGCTPIWTAFADEQPALSLRFPDGDVLEVRPEVYRLKSAPHTQQLPPELIEDQTARYQGFFRGDTVVVIGQLVEDSGASVFWVSEFAVGTRAAHLQRLRDARDGFQRLAVALSALAGVAGVVWLWGWRRPSAVEGGGQSV